MLYLIGDGSLKEEIDTLIDSLNIRSRVILVGILENPSELLKYCDCFIFTSLHEGQPVVIHEARVAGLPIVMTKFSSYKGSVVKDGQYLIGMDEEGILKGMNAFANGEVPTTYEYDYVKNNHEVYKEFLTAIGARKLKSKVKLCKCIFTEFYFNVNCFIKNRIFLKVYFWYGN